MSCRASCARRAIAHGRLDAELGHLPRGKSGCLDRGRSRNPFGTLPDTFSFPARSAATQKSAVLNLVRIGSSRMHCFAKFTLGTFAAIFMQRAEVRERL